MTAASYSSGPMTLTTVLSWRRGAGRRGLNAGRLRGMFGIRPVAQGEWHFLGFLLSCGASRGVIVLRSAFAMRPELISEEHSPYGPIRSLGVASAQTPSRPPVASGRGRDGVPPSIRI